MFNLKDAYKEVTLEEVYSKIGEYALWKYYVHNFKEIGKNFKSEFYNDKNPSCSIYMQQNGKMLYKDFGTGDTYTIIDYIMYKYNCTFKECLTIIANDFNLRKLNYNKPVNIPKLTLEEIIVLQSKSSITIEPQSYNYIDFIYWNKYGISLELLQEYNVYSCKYVFLYKNDNTRVFEYTKNNPIYAYKFVYDGKISYKIYFPLAEKKYKWLFNGGVKENIEGYDQLRLHGDVLILTKSLKDCMCYRALGYDAISLQGEANKLEKDLVDKLLKRFNSIIINYDSDEQGIKSTNKLVEQYNFRYFFIDEEKDLSDYISKFGIDKAAEMLNKKING